MSDTGNKPNTSYSKTKPGLKICCACPETKKARDECVIQFGEAKCEISIEAHKECLRKEGFDI